MARRRRRHYGAVSLDLGNAVLPLNKAVNSTDVAVGMGAGIAGITGIGYLVNKVLSPTLVPAAIKPYLPVLSGMITAAGLYFVEKRSYKAIGHAAGAVLAGVAIQAMDMVREKLPGMADVVSLRLNGYNGFIVNDGNPALNGFIVNDGAAALNGYADHPGMADLAALSLGGEETLEASAP